MKAEIVLDIIKFVFGSLGLGSLITAFVTTKIRKSAREKELKCEEQTRLILKQQEINEINAATNKIVITSYSIHYTKLYEYDGLPDDRRPETLELGKAG